MSSSSIAQDETTLRHRLDRDFMGAATWPPSRAALMALIDLGLSDDRIAGYFSVSLAEVARLRDAYGFAAPAPH